MYTTITTGNWDRLRLRALRKMERTILAERRKPSGKSVIRNMASTNLRAHAKPHRCTHHYTIKRAFDVGCHLFQINAATILCVQGKLAAVSWLPHVVVHLTTVAMFPSTHILQSASEVFSGSTQFVTNAKTGRLTPDHWLDWHLSWRLPFAASDDVVSQTAGATQRRRE